MLDSLPLSALQRLPIEWPQDLLPQIQAAVSQQTHKVVVLDDDPTGTQTVYDMPVLMTWALDDLVMALQDKRYPAFFILTNSRSLDAPAAAALNREIARNLQAASQQTSVALEVISRSDSTLRGHFPLETDILAEELETAFDGCLMVPFFAEGGRYTLDDVHYVAEGGALIPAAQTPFAQDRAFGYSQSNLRAWVAEKTGGRVRAEAVQSISLAAIRQGGPDVVTEQLSQLRDGAVCIVNAASRKDLHVLVAALLRLRAQGKRLLYRTAASFVQARLGLAERPLLRADDLIDQREGSGGGLIVVGSYVPKTTRQLEHLRAHGEATVIEIDVPQLLAASETVVHDAAKQMNSALAAGHDVIVATSRDLATGHTAAENLAIGRAVSEGLIQVVQRLTSRPRYVLAKGGITSSDMATQGLGMTRALIRGQILPGVPVWQPGAGCRYPGLPYIVFPGNVGADDALTQVVNELR